MPCENVVLVNKNDIMIGTMEKMAAHRAARLHRAISVFIFNSKGEMLLQRRAANKYHSAGKWSNTCCSHPRPGELSLDAAQRRLQEEMGLYSELELAFCFTYHSDLENGLYEHEYDHVYIGTTDMVPKPDVLEAESFIYLKPETVEKDLFQNPQTFTAWFKICFERVMEHFRIKENER